MAGIPSAGEVDRRERLFPEVEEETMRCDVNGKKQWTPRQSAANMKPLTSSRKPLQHANQPKGKSVGIG